MPKSAFIIPIPPALARIQNGTPPPPVILKQVLLLNLIPCLPCLKPVVHPTADPEPSYMCALLVRATRVCRLVGIAIARNRILPPHKKLEATKQLVTVITAMVVTWVV